MFNKKNDLTFLKNRVFKVLKRSHLRIFSWVVIELRLFKSICVLMTLFDYKNYYYRAPE